MSQKDGVRAARARGRPARPKPTSADNTVWHHAVSNRGRPLGRIIEIFSERKILVYLPYKCLASLHFERLSPYTEAEFLDAQLGQNSYMETSSHPINALIQTTNTFITRTAILSPTENTVSVRRFWILTDLRRGVRRPKDAEEFGQKTGWLARRLSQFCLSPSSLLSGARDLSLISLCALLLLWWTSWMPAFNKPSKRVNNKLKKFLVSKELIQNGCNFNLL
jgi:hypothetical protein